MCVHRVLQNYPSTTEPINGEEEGGGRERERERIFPSLCTSFCTFAVGRCHCGTVQTEAAGPCALPLRPHCGPNSKDYKLQLSPPLRPPPPSPHPPPPASGSTSSSITRSKPRAHGLNRITSARSFAGARLARHSAGSSARQQGGAGAPLSSAVL